jgi:hypothetical protein
MEGSIMARNARITVAAAALLAATVVSAQGSNNGASVGSGGFLLNVIAFEQCPAGDFLDSNRHQIAVEANYTGNGTDKTAKTNKIFLKAGEDFQVYDGNACEGGAEFYLPISELNCDSGCDLIDPTFTEYEVRARLVGQPGGHVEVTSCVQETEDDSIIVDDDTLNDTADSLCSVGSNVWVSTREVGNGKVQNKFENVSQELLTVCVDTDGDSTCDERIGLFDPRGQDYWWNWDTSGRPHVQLVFVPVLTGS